MEARENAGDGRLLLKGAYHPSCGLWGPTGEVTLAHEHWLTEPGWRGYGPAGMMGDRPGMWARGGLKYCRATAPPSSPRWPEVTATGRNFCEARSCFRCLARRFWNQTCGEKTAGERRKWRDEYLLVQSCGLRTAFSLSSTWGMLLSEAWDGPSPVRVRVRSD